MQENGFSVTVKNANNLGEIKIQYQVPLELQSCHTAIVDGYVVEGHVPAQDVRQMLAERPDILGIAVAGMPAGSPGMESGDNQEEPYSVIAFDASGNQEVVATYP